MIFKLNASQKMKVREFPVFHNHMLENFKEYGTGTFENCMDSKFWSKNSDLDRKIPWFSKFRIWKSHWSQKISVWKFHGYYCSKLKMNLTRPTVSNFDGNITKNSKFLKSQNAPKYCETLRMDRARGSDRTDPSKIK